MGVATSSDETESRLRLESERPRMAVLNSDLRAKAEWEWRRRSTETENEVKNRYFAELGLVMRISERLRVLASASQESELYTTDAKSAGAEGEVRVSVRPDRRRRLYRVDMQAQPTKALTFGANTMLIDQDESPPAPATAGLLFWSPAGDSVGIPAVPAPLPP